MEALPVVSSPHSLFHGESYMNTRSIAVSVHGTGLQVKVICGSRKTILCDVYVDEEGIVGPDKPAIRGK